MRIILPFKDQRSANSVRRQLGELSRKIGKHIHPVYTTRKIGSNIRPEESKPPIVNQQCVVDHFKCDLCDADAVGYTCRHLYQRIEEHKRSAIGKHVRDQHGRDPSDISLRFKILRKCQSKFDCLIYEAFFYKRTKANLEHAVCLHPRKVIFIARSILYILLKSFLSYCCLAFFLVFDHLQFATLSTYFIAFHILTRDFTSYMESFIHFFSHT